MGYEGAFAFRERPAENRSVKLSILIPVYNEKGTILEILRRVFATPYPKQVVLVDDGSTDGTRQVLQQLKEDPASAGFSGQFLTILFHESNRGKGAAIRTALQEINGDVVIIQDADLEYDPKDYGRLIEPFLLGVADVVYGNRFHGGLRRAFYFWHAVGNRIITLLANVLTNLILSDIEVGYKAFSAPLLKKLCLKSNRFGIEAELTIKAARAGARIYEVPISYFGRSYAEGKKITWRDGAAALGYLVWFRFFSR